MLDYIMFFKKISKKGIQFMKENKKNIPRKTIYYENELTYDSVKNE